MDGQDGPQDTTDWIGRLNRRELGAMTATVRRVQTVVGSDRSSLQDLTRALQNDPALVAKVLRIANSPTYHVGSEQVTTITRASTLIGFDAIRNICITNRLLEVLLVEESLPERIANRLLTRIASALHAAIQTRGMLRKAPAQEREEAFLAALVEGIGECAFWGSGGPEVEALDAALSAAPPEKAEEIVREHLGGSFRELSSALAQHWGLGGLAASERGREIVALASDLALVVAAEGWHGAGLRSIFPRAAVLLGVDASDAARRLRACGKEAEELATHFGAAILARRMARRPAEEEMARLKALDYEEQRPARVLGTTANSAAQLRALQSMSSLAEAGADANAVILAALEGIHEGLGMERSIVALLSTDRRLLQTRLARGEGEATWGKDFRFEAASGRGVLQDCIIERKAFQFRARSGEGARAIAAGLMRFCAGQDFLLAPIVIGGRSIGALYCDRAPSGLPIADDEFAAFLGFARQLGMCLASRGARRDS